MGPGEMGRVWIMQGCVVSLQILIPAAVRRFQADACTQSVGKVEKKWSDVKDI